VIWSLIARFCVCIRQLVGVVEGREREANARRQAAESAQERLASEKRQLQDHLQVRESFTEKPRGMALEQIG
jgi:hypothetical protein